MIALELAIQAYADHAMLSVAEVKRRITAGDSRVCTTVARIRLTVEQALYSI